MYRSMAHPGLKAVAASLMHPDQDVKALKRFLRDLTGQPHEWVEFELVESMEGYLGTIASLVHPPGETFDRQA